MEFNNLNFCEVVDCDEAFAQVFARHFAQCGLQVATNKFGEPAEDAAFKEMKQLHDRIVFNPLDAANVMQKERRQALESLILLKRSMMNHSKEEHVLMAGNKESSPIQMMQQVQQLHWNQSF